MKILGILIIILSTSCSKINKSKFDQLQTKDSTFSQNDHDKSVQITNHNYEVISKVEGFLNNDTLMDYALILQHPDSLDSRLLQVYLKLSDRKDSLILQTANFISSGYDDNIIIESRKLIITSGYHWHGANVVNYCLKFNDGKIYCTSVSSYHEDNNDLWQISFDYESGGLNVKHEFISADGKDYVKEVNGILNNESPFLADSKEFMENLTILYNGIEYYLCDRNSLFSEDEIFNLLPKNYKDIVGYWKSKDSSLSISFESDGYVYGSISDKEAGQLHIQGNFEIIDDSVFVNLTERDDMKFFYSSAANKKQLTNETYTLIRQDEK
jgi:hypothetical protein